MKRKSIGIALIVALGLVGLANGATISWTSAPALTQGGWGQDLSPGLFDTNGVPVYAENMGGPAYTFDGIDFTEGTTVFAGGGTTNFYGEIISSGWESTLQSTGTWGPPGSASTVTLTGLSIGTNYVVQALVYDGRGEIEGSGRSVEFDGVDQGVYANGQFGVTWGPGLLMTGTFTADATNQNFMIEAFEGATSLGGLLNVLAVFDPNGIVAPAPPVWADPIVVGSGQVDVPYSDTLDGQATDPNGDPITFSLAASTPDWLDVASNGVITNNRVLVEADVGTNDFNVVASDGVSGSTTGLLQIVIAPAPPVVEGELLTNGDFEDPVVAGERKILLDDEPNFITGWTLTGSEAGHGAALLESNWDFWGSGLVATNGQYMSFNGADITVYGDSIEQTFATSIGDEIVVSYMVGNGSFGAITSAMRLDVTSDGGALGDLVSQVSTQATDNAFTTFTAQFTASSALTTIRFTDMTTGTGISSDTLLDQVSATVISTPSLPVTVMISGPVAGGTGMEISWVGAVGKTYGVETTASLITGGWLPVASGLPGTDGTTTITNTISGDETFYRVITE